jgi:uncharacterized protein
MLNSDKADFDYDEMVQNALRGVVREILSDVAVNGLRGEHHYYIAFTTGEDGVSLPAYLKERYPAEMTIVLQHQFWGLVVRPSHFEINLSFSGVPERLVIPFDAVIGFLDPSVQFGLQFRVSQVDESSEKPSQAARKSSRSGGRAATSLGDPAPAAGQDNVVTLDSFRKK